MQLVQKQRIRFCNLTNSALTSAHWHDRMMPMQVKRTALPRIPLRVKIRGTKEYAGMVELADTLDLGSNGQPCRFKSCCPYQIE